MPGKPSFVATVRLLMRMARTRAHNRSRRQREILNQRSRKKPSWNLGVLAYPILLLVGFFLHMIFAISVYTVADDAMQADFTSHGKMKIGGELTGAIKSMESPAWESSFLQGYPQWKNSEALNKAAQRQLDAAFSNEARREVPDDDNGAAARERELRKHYKLHGLQGFITSWPSLAEGLEKHPSPLAEWTGLFMLCWWFMMITFQGEGLELDVQRRRHPMWEWLFSHPARPGAVFLSEMLSPLAANPNIILAPAFWIILLSFSGNFFLACIIPGLLIGIPLAVSAACINKTMETCVMLRVAPRNRGAIIGLMSWLGFVSYAAVFAVLGMSKSLEVGMHWLERFTPEWNPHIFGLMIGVGGLWVPVLITSIFSLIAIGTSVLISSWATERGIAGGFGGAPAASPLLTNLRGTKWMRDPLYHKELLWFWRDRGALVQTILIPLSVAAYQLFNMRGLIEMAAGQWHWLCTVAVVFGTYFLFILGPRSLISEGQAMWIALTWPRGMENLLGAKARLWWLLANIPVGLGLLLAVVLYPSAWWQVALVGAGWLMFSRSLAVKTVTLVQAPSSSGETEPVPAGRRGAAWLGTMTFASGIATKQWHLALVGVVYSWVTAAAMWQHFRERLPYLFDPWSERLPKPPTVMHAMIAILAMTECTSLVSAIIIGAGGKAYLWMAMSIAYALAGGATWLATRKWLADRDVPDHAIWHWNDGRAAPAIWWTLLIGLAFGAGLGLLLTCLSGITAMVVAGSR